jgi:hypothetical protein
MKPAWSLTCTAFLPQVVANVGGQHGVVGADAVELGEQVLLGGEVLDDRLDDEIALAQLAEVGDGTHPAEDRVALGGLELAAVDLLGERLLEACDHRVGGALGAAAQDHFDPGLGRDLGDAGAHDPRTHDADALDRHHSRSCLKFACWKFA